MYKISKLFFLLTLCLIPFIVIINFDLLSYAVAQGYGQLRIVWNSKPIAEVMEAPSTPDSLRKKLEYINQVRKYAIDSLSLNDTDNYKTYYDQRGKEILWVVTACEPYALKEKTWEFPVVGKVPYKGFFSPENAKEEAEKLKSLGLDVSIRNPGGWSTLGWFNDPVLSGMLFRNKGDLASLIIHEMVHSTIYVKNNSNFNENLASFIGDEGSKKFLKSHYGSDSETLTSFLNEESDYRIWTNHFLNGAKVLDSLYKSQHFLKSAEQQKIIMKTDLIKKIVLQADTLSLSSFPTSSVYFKDRMPNNAFFMSHIRYQAMQTDFSKIYAQEFEGDIQKMINHYRKKFPFL